MTVLSPIRRAALIVVAVILCGCASQPPVSPEVADQAGGSRGSSRPEPLAVLRALLIDRQTEDRILALDPNNISADDVKNTLSMGPAPRVVLLHGGIYPVHLIMVSAGRFLTTMGYPENRVRHPGDNRWSHSPYEPSNQITGLIAWYYEHDGMRPMMIGHSQGGIQAVKVLYDLDGRFDKEIRVWNPYADAAEDRTMILDPLNGIERPVVGLTVSYASAVGAGGAALLLPNQWNMADKLHNIPDTVDEFTGFSIDLDLIAWTVQGAKETTQFKRKETAEVRSVMLPASYSHVFVPVVHSLAQNQETRDWIEKYTPTDANNANPPDGNGLLWAADVWHSVKKHWAIEAQTLIRARRIALGTPR